MMELCDAHNDFAPFGLEIPEVLLPATNVDLGKWSVIACDQYTAQPGYWQKVADYVGDSPSALHLIFPEVYLGGGGVQERIDRIHRQMMAYLHEGVLVQQEPGFIYVERLTADRKLRRGLMAALDLECYDFGREARTLIRATEETVLERIPPRVKIRAGAPLELPHVLTLIDDPERRVIERVAARVDRLTRVYSTDLMMRCGHTTGYLVTDKEIVDDIRGGLRSLKEEASSRQGMDIGTVPLFAVGDGNHSLAAAKAHWENLKRAGVPARHPARYALVELVNVYDDGLVFEPIHRVLFHAPFEELKAAMENHFNTRGAGFELEAGLDRQTMEARLGQARQERGAHRIGLIDQGGFGVITIHNPPDNLAVGTLQAFLDEFLRETGAGIDYIHGNDVIAELGSRPGNMGFYLPPMDKSELFRTVALGGLLPRKTFSMGEAADKRFYMECRRIA